MKYLFCLLLAVPALAGCVKDELSMLVLGAHTIKLLPEGGASVPIRQGNGGYAAVSDRPQTVSVQIEDDTLRLAAQAAGTATITVTDSKGQDAELRVTVGPIRVRFTVGQYALQIEPAGIQDKEAIEKELLREAPLPVGAYYECEYLTATRPDGNLTVLLPKTEEQQELQYTGTFDQTPQLFTFRYGGKTWQYAYQPYDPPKKPAGGSRSLAFAEDPATLTAAYQAKFPGAGLTRVNRAQIVTITQP